MRRRTVLALTGSLATVSLTGCSSSDGTASPTSDEDTPSVDTQAVRKQIGRCETHYIRTEIISDDQELLDPLSPRIEELDTRDDGVYATVETRFGTNQIIATPEEGPPVVDTADYGITAYYYHGSNGTFRTEEPYQDPTNGSQVQCE